MSDKFTEEQLSEAKAQFSGPCTFMLSVAHLEQLPEPAEYHGPAALYGNLYGQL